MHQEGEMDRYVQADQEQNRVADVVPCLGIVKPVCKCHHVVHEDDVRHFVVDLHLCGKR